MSHPLSIVHLCRTGWPHLGGMEAVMGGLASALIRRGHHVRVVTLDVGPDGRPLLPGVWGGVPYQRLRGSGPRRYPFAWGLEQALQGTDVIHVHGVDGLLHQALRTRGRGRARRVGVTPHGAFLHTSRDAAIKQVWLRTGAAVALGSADAVWFTSAHEQALLAPTGAPGVVLPNGVDVARFAGVPRAPEEGRWLVFGRVDVHKGLDLLLERLAAVAMHDPRPFQLRVLGAEAKAGLIDALTERARRLGIRHRVRFLGPAAPAELLAELARCEFALFPSRAEAFGVAVVEAQAAGVPVVVQDIPPFRELVRDGFDGFVVDFRQGEASRRLRNLRGKAQGVSAEARSSSQRFAWEVRVVPWEEQYRALVAR